MGAAQSYRGRQPGRIIARSYAYVMCDGEIPEEIRLANAVDRYGAYGVYGRPMSALDIQRIEMAENYIGVCRAWKAADNKADWELSNPGVGAAFKYALGLAMDMGLVKEPADA